MAKVGGNPQYLTPFKKGNPIRGGRPKGSISLTTTLKKIINKEIQFKNPLNRKKETKTIREWINLALVAKAMKGDINAIKHIYDRIDGKVAQELIGDLNISVKEMSIEQLNEIANS